jgi:hypothetical protein
VTLSVVSAIAASMAKVRCMVFLLQVSGQGSPGRPGWGGKNFGNRRKIRR